MMAGVLHLISHQLAVLQLHCHVSSLCQRTTASCKPGKDMAQDTPHTHYTLHNCTFQMPPAEAKCPANTMHSNNGQPACLLAVTSLCSCAGVVTPTHRRQQIYSVCRRHDVIILEDDPYFYLQFAEGGTPRGLQGLGQSYLSLDVDGRVIRLDSLSKVNPQSQSSQTEQLVIGTPRLTVDRVIALCHT